jgi:hypothetical protein
VRRRFRAGEGQIRYNSNKLSTVRVVPSSKVYEAPKTQPLNLPKVLTGKERLGKKWMDEQRIDNCKVPIDKRGTKPRPSICPHVSMGTVRPGAENLHV